MTNDPLFDSYESECSYSTCLGKKRLLLNVSCGLKVGDLVFPTSDFSFDKCPVCKRASLKITSVPKPSEPNKPEGFWKTPTS